MPVSKSGKKTVRKNEERRMANKTTRSSMRSQVKKVEAAIDAGDKEAAQAEMKLATKKMDKAAKSNVIHKNQAANKKSSLTKRFNAVS